MSERPVRTTPLSSRRLKTSLLQGRTTPKWKMRSRPTDSQSRTSGRRQKKQIDSTRKFKPYITVRHRCWMMLPSGYASGSARQERTSVRYVMPR